MKKLSLTKPLAPWRKLFSIALLHNISRRDRNSRYLSYHANHGTRIWLPMRDWVEAELYSQYEEEYW